MKKGIILSSLFLFILASTAGEETLFHKTSPVSENIMSGSDSSPLNEDDILTMICEDTEEMEGRNRVLPVAMARNNTESSAPAARATAAPVNHLIFRESFLIFPRHLRAPPSPVIG